MATTITKKGTFYLRPSAWVNQGDFTETETPGIVNHCSGWFNTTNAWEAVNEVTADENTTIWTYSTSATSEQSGDGTFKCALCHEIPTVPYKITAIQSFARGRIEKRTGIWSGTPSVSNICVTVSGNGGSSGDGTSGGATIGTDWGNTTKTISTSVLSSLNYAANTIPDLNFRVYNRVKGSLRSGQFYLKITQIYIKVDYEYYIVVDVNDSSKGRISGYTGGGDSTTTATITTEKVGSGDDYFAGWYTQYNSGGKEHYRYTNRVGTDLTYNWSLSNPYLTLYAVWYDYPIQIAAGGNRVKHIYRGTTEVTSVYRGNTKIYWPNAKWEEIG